MDDESQLRRYVEEANNGNDVAIAVVKKKIKLMKKQLDNSSYPDNTIVIAKEEMDDHPIAASWGEKFYVTTLGNLRYREEMRQYWGGRSSSRRRRTGRRRKIGRRRRTGRRRR